MLDWTIPGKRKKAMSIVSVPCILHHCNPYCILYAWRWSWCSWYPNWYPSWPTKAAHSSNQQNRSCSRRDESQQNTATYHDWAWWRGCLNSMAVRKEAANNVFLSWNHCKGTTDNTSGLHGPSKAVYVSWQCSNSLGTGEQEWQCKAVRHLSKIILTWSNGYYNMWAGCFCYPSLVGCYTRWLGLWSHIHYLRWACRI